MWSNVVNLRVALTAAAIAALSVFATPRSAAAQAPSGTYTKSCRNSYVSRDGILHAECKNVVGQWGRTTLNMNDCRDRDIINRNGTLACGDRINGDDNGRSDNGRWSHTRGRGRGDDNDRNAGWGRGGRRSGGVTLFANRGYRGQSMYVGEDYTNLGTTGFNDLASSVRIEGGGTWRLCSDKNYGGRCVNVTSSVSDLSRIGLTNNISSIRRVQ